MPFVHRHWTGGPRWRERLVAVGKQLLERELRPSALAFTRLIIAEAQRVPDIAQEAGRVRREDNVLRVAKTIAGTRPQEPTAIELAAEPAALFVEMVLGSHQMRALLGENASALLEDAERRIDTTIDMLEKLGLLAAWVRPV